MTLMRVLPANISQGGVRGGPGTPPTATRTNIDTADPISWDPVTQRCMSGLVDGAVVHWAVSHQVGGARGGPIHKPECCNVVTMIGAQWYAHLLSEGEGDAGIDAESSAA